MRRDLNKRLALGVASVAGFAVCAFGAFDNKSEIEHDAQLRAMVDELARSKTLKLNDLDKPYFVSYSDSDSEQMSIQASLGGITGSNAVHLRQPRIDIRVGDYAFDNTNSIFSRVSGAGLLPVDDDYQAIRTHLWLSTDSLYKTAADEITRKRAALREIADPEHTPDFAPAKPTELMLPVSKLTANQKQWEDRLRRLSGEFAKYPEVTNSSLRLLAIASTYRVVNTEGTIVRMPQDLVNVDIRGSSLAADGSRVWNHAQLTTLKLSELPDEQNLLKLVDAVASETDLLRKAPVAEEYVGPVLFEQEAAAQMMAEVMTESARLPRRPLAPPGAQQPPFIDNVWASRMNTRVTPEWMTIVDDPSQKQYGGNTLAGQYPVDDEGVPGTRVVLVEKGMLKNFLLSREPVKNYNSSNGHGRLPGGYGSEAAVIGNLFVQVDQPVPEDQMKAKLLERVKTAGLKYGIIVRRLDFPSTADVQELQSMARQMQKNGNSRTLASPILAFRAYPDGREELIRGVRFKEFSAKELRDVALASDKPYVLNYVNNGSVFDFADISSSATTSSVICPSMLFESVELDRAQDDLNKAPLVPAPALTAQR